MSAPRLSVVSPPPHPRRGATARGLPQWECEHQLVGALLHLTAAKAAPILELVPATAIWLPENRWAYELIGHLVAGGHDPDPVVVLSLAHHRQPTDASFPRRRVTEGRHHQFAVHLADLYTGAVNPAAVQQYAREVLDEAYRRAVAAHGEHLHQLANDNISRDDLTDYLTAMRAHLADLWRRGEAARSPREAS